MAKRRFLISACNASTLKPLIWCADNHLPMPSQGRNFPNIVSTHKSIAADPNGKFLAGVRGDSSRNGYIWSLEENKEIVPVFALASAAHHFAAISNDGKRILFGNTVASQNYYRLLDIETWSDIPLQGGLPTAECVTGGLSNDSRYVVLVQMNPSNLSYVGAVFLYDTHQNTRKSIVFTADSFGGGWYSAYQGLNVHFSQDDSEFIVCLGYNINRYETESGTRIGWYQINSYDNVTQSCYSPDGRFFCAVTATSTTSRNNLWVYDTASWNHITAASLATPKYMCYGCVFSPDSSLLYVSIDKGVVVLNTANWTIFQTLGPLNVTPNALCITPEIGGTISNELTTPVVDAMNQPVQRVVVARVRDLPQLSIAGPSDLSRGSEVSIATTDENGRYDLPIFYTNEPYMVTFYADNDAENSVTVDWVTAE